MLQILFDDDDVPNALPLAPLSIKMQSHIESHASVAAAFVKQCLANVYFMSATQCLTNAYFISANQCLTNVHFMSQAMFGQCIFYLYQ